MWGKVEFFQRFCAGVLCFVLVFTLNDTVVKADGTFLLGTTIFCDTSEEGCSADELSTAKFICVNKLTEEGLDKVLSNNNLEQIQIANITNLPIEKVSQLYPYLCKDNIEYSAILLAYESVKDSVGNDGTPAYMYAVEEYAPASSTYYRSCATTVSAILNAAGYLDGYSSAGCSGLVNYFESHPSEWDNMGQLTPEEMQEGDVVFIDRQSHKEDYIKGMISDSEFDLKEVLETLTLLESMHADTLDLGADEMYWDAEGNYYLPENDQYGYYAPGHKWVGYETEGGVYDPYGNVVPKPADYPKNVANQKTESEPELQQPVGINEVFKPDEDEDGVISAKESEKWATYWLNKTGEIPDYSYYDTWKKETDEYKEVASEALSNFDIEELKAANGGKLPVIHNHIIVWLGNDVVQKYYPESTGNIISGSYSETYSKARSAAVSNFNFTGDYRIYRHKRS